MGARPPGWEGVKAKPVKDRRCPATVIRLRGEPGRPPKLRPQQPSRKGGGLMI